MALFGAAAYVGYFGAGGGVLLLAVLGVMVEETLARLNAIKNVVSGLANFVAAAGFALFAPVRWSFVDPLAACFLIGGWTGPKIVRRMPAPGLRIAVPPSPPRPWPYGARGHARPRRLPVGTRPHPGPKCVI